MINPKGLARGSRGPRGPHRRKPKVVRGEKRGRGRPKGSPNVVTRMLKEAILLGGEGAGNLLAETDTMLRGDPRRPEGMIAYMQWLALNYPTVYGALVSRVLPLQTQAVKSEDWTPYKTRQEIEAAMREHGLPVERIYPPLEFKPIEQDVIEES
jgi:hypothetical protein